MPPKPTIFTHWAFEDYELYPEGIADAVGYWAEDRILGGVTIFARIQEARAPHLPVSNAYFHSSRKDVTRRIYKLTDDQQKRLIDFFLADEMTTEKECHLPILGSKDNIERVSVWESHWIRGIFRDIWEQCSQ